MKRIAAVMALSFLLSGQILWASDTPKPAFVGSGNKSVDDAVFAGMVGNGGKDVAVVAVGEKDPARILERLREIRPDLVVAVGNRMIRKLAGIGSEFYILCLTDNYLRREGLMPKDGL
jgi:hypothetical protein